MALTPLKHDFSILKDLGLEDEPVGIKFMFYKPKGIERLDKELALCEMIKEAQSHDKPFYIDKFNEDCIGCAGLGMLGPGDGPAYGPSGEIGQHCKVFKDNAANMRCMSHYTTFDPGSCNYVVFAKLSCMDFEPDLIQLYGDVEKMGIALRALSWSTGCALESKTTNVFQCSWLFSYPHITGNFNFVTYGLGGHGSVARKIFKPGDLIASIPSNWFATWIENLHEMEWVPRGWDLPTREDWIEDEKKMYAAMQKEFDEADWS